jgi:putative ABC transport system permease protein
MNSRPGWRPVHHKIGDPESDIELELQLHLEGRVEEYVATGMTENDARRLAMERFGELDHIASQCRRANGVERSALTQQGKAAMSAMWQDIRYAVRTLVNRPGFTSAVVLTLILAIGATTAVFSVVNGVLLHPLPHPNPEQLVLVHEVDARSGFLELRNRVTAANFADWREQHRTFQGMAGFQDWAVTFRGDGDPERVSHASVSSNFFEVLGITPILGRAFLPEEEEPANSGVVLLSYRFWQSHFGGDSSIVGQGVGIGSGSFTVVGVLPAGFDFLDRDQAVFTPLSLSSNMYQNRRSHILWVVARMQPGVTRQTAQQDMDRVVDGLREAYPEFLSGWGVNVEPLTDAVVGNIRPALLVLLGAVAFVLLIATVNVANLMLARTSAEQREVAIRAALGAARGRLVRQKLTESIILAVAGGAAGVLVASVATRALLAAAPAGLPQVDQIGVDGRVLGFALLLSVVTGLLFGVIPAVQASRPAVSSYLKEGSRGSTGGRGHQRLRAGFVVTQLAFSLVLLISAGLMMTTFARLMRVDPGFDPGGTLTLQITPMGRDYPTVEEQTAHYDRLILELASLPQVRQAAATNFLPLRDDEATWSAFIQGQPMDREGVKRDYGYHGVSTDYFQTMGIALKQGRAFTDFDRAGAPPVMIVNESFVQRFFPNGESPVGQRMSINGRESIWMEIIGVVEDVHHYSLDMEPLPAYYGPYTQVPWNWFLGVMNLVVRTDGDPVAMMSSVRRVIRTIDPTIVVSEVQTMRDNVSRSVARSRFAMILLGVFAAVALSLAVVGIYGVISYSVGQRGQEIGVRIALGAEPPRIVGQFLLGGMKLLGVGVAVGLAGAILFTRFQASLLYGVEAVDPLTYGAVTAVLCAVALLATYIPARRASRVDPMTVLRDE